MIDVNLTGMFLTVQSVYQHMIERQSGKIVCIGSVAGKIGGVIAGAGYVASKGGVHSFIKVIAKEAAPRGCISIELPLGQLIVICQMEYQYPISVKRYLCRD
ncbi:NAD(P)-dependent dehydrogenase (short-subunit alcohol dehydrogenase family) [Virgibacillus halotolerans]|nr:NAD(P)-dependent dehydrogenase (short-subunit alcohol dehydrogenase family) [Virgibacillus halotolerans]